MVFGNVDVGFSGPDSAETQITEAAKQAGWAIDVPVPALPPKLEEFFGIKGNTLIDLCPVCRATRERVAKESRRRAETAWDTWDDEEVEREIAAVTDARARLQATGKGGEA